MQNSMWSFILRSLVSTHGVPLPYIFKHQLLPLFHLLFVCPGTTETKQNKKMVGYCKLRSKSYSATGSMCYPSWGITGKMLKPEDILTRAATMKTHVGTSFPKASPFCELFSTCLCCPKSIQTDYLSRIRYSKTYSSLGNHLLKYQNYH